MIITEEGRVTASTLGKGKAGDIEVKAGEIRMEAGKIFSDSKSKGDGGDAGMVELEGEVINILANARVGSNTEGKGSAGAIRIKGGEVNVIDGAIQTNSNNHMEDGVAGSIEIEADRLVVMQDKGSGFIDGVISSDTRGRGDGGTMTIKAEVLELDGGQINTRSGWFSPITSGGGKAGSIGIEAEEVRMSNNAKISSSTWTQGDGGEVKISGDALVLSGESTSINTFSAYGTFAHHEEGKGGTGGKIEIGVKEVQVVDGSNISASSRGSGDAGSVKLDSESIWVDGEGRITSSSGSKDRGTRFGYDLITTGDAGSVEINSKSVVVGNSGLISVSTRDEGQGGELIINADSVKIHEKGKLLSNTQRKGNGGSILLRVLN